MRDDWVSMTSSTRSDYDRFNYYYVTRKPTTDKLKKVGNPIPKKPEIHIFDIKDLDLKEK